MAIENCMARFRLSDWLDGRPIQPSCGLAHGMADSPVHWSHNGFVAKRLPERRPDPGDVGDVAAAAVVTPKGAHGP